MPLFQKRNTGQQLRELLDQEYDCLTCGRLDQLGMILNSKQKLFDDLRGARPAADLLAEIRRKAERNQHLIEAAGRGIRAAIDRLEKLSKADTDLVTYDQGGRLQGAATPKGTTRRRA